MVNRKLVHFFTITLTIIISVMFSASASTNDADISSLSYDELVTLKNKINLAIQDSKEWQEVQVPQGEWIVGEDIPVGKWTVRCADVNRKSYILQECEIKWGFRKSNGNLDTSSSKGGGSVQLFNPNNENAQNGRTTEITADLQEGMVVQIDDFYAPAVFTPYAGKPDMVFYAGNER